MRSITVGKPESSTRTLGSHSCSAMRCGELVVGHAFGLGEQAVGLHDLQRVGGGDEHLGEERVRVESDRRDQLVEFVLVEQRLLRHRREPGERAVRALLPEETFDLVCVRLLREGGCDGARAYAEDGRGSDRAPDPTHHVSPRSITPRSQVVTRRPGRKFPAPFRISGELPAETARPGSGPCGPSRRQLVGRGTGMMATLRLSGSGTPSAVATGRSASPASSISISSRGTPAPTRKSATARGAAGGEAAVGGGAADAVGVADEADARRASGRRADRGGGGVDLAAGGEPRRWRSRSGSATDSAATAA